MKRKNKVVKKTIKNVPWTRFMDMHSGGGLKEKDWQYIYIQAPQSEAEVIFYNRFGHNPHRVTCTCCGEDYVVNESKTFEQASGYDRGCAYDDKKKVTVAEYKKRKDVLVISDNEIRDSERVGDIPEQGYVWKE